MRTFRRRLCTCGHALADHAAHGGRCLATVNDPDKTALVQCYCHGYDERPPRAARLSDNP